MTSINRDNPITEPAVPEKTYPHNWVYKLNISAPDTSSATVRFALIPYNYNTKELHPQGLEYTEILDCDDLFTAIDEVPEVATAYNAIINAIEPLKTWLAQRG
jgi:hypothetical protein